MKRLSYILFCMILIMCFATGTTAQQLVGESESFIFDTRGAVIPLSNSILLIFFILAGSTILVRYYLQKRKKVV